MADLRIASWRKARSAWWKLRHGVSLFWGAVTFSPVLASASLQGKAKASAPYSLERPDSGNAHRAPNPKNSPAMANHYPVFVCWLDGSVFLLQHTD